jgi:hypothetical protein
MAGWGSGKSRQRGVGERGRFAGVLLFRAATLARAGPAVRRGVVPGQLASSGRACGRADDDEVPAKGRRECRPPTAPSRWRPGWPAPAQGSPGA